MVLPRDCCNASKIRSRGCSTFGNDESALSSIMSSRKSRESSVRSLRASATDSIGVLCCEISGMVVDAILLNSVRRISGVHASGSSCINLLGYLHFCANCFKRAVFPERFGPVIISKEFCSILVNSVCSSSSLVKYRVIVDMIISYPRNLCRW